MRAYLFRDGKRHVAVVWAPTTKPRPIRLTDERIELWDLMGRPQPSRQFTPSGTPVYLVSEGLSDEAFESHLR